MDASSANFSPTPNSEKRLAPSTRRGRPRLDIEPRRQRIIEAAAELFIQHGYAATTLDAVSKASRVTKRTIYEVVGDKQALFRAICHHCFSGIGEARFDVRIRCDNLVESLIEMAQWLVHHSVSHETVTIVRAAVTERMRSPELVGDIIASTKSDLFGQIAGFFEELAARDLVTIADPLETAKLFYDMSVGTIGFRRALGHDEPIPTRAEIGWRVGVFIRGHLNRGVPTDGI